MKNHLHVDEIVVGAGLTGLVYANVMAAAGRRVVVVEKHTKPGGYASNFSRKREFVFDCSLHKITGFGENGNLADALRRANLDHLVPFYHYEHLTTFILDDEHLSLPADGAALTQLLLDHFPHEAPGLTRFFQDINQIGRQNYMLARMALGEFEMDTELFSASRKLSRISTYEYLLECFQDKQLITLLCSLAINLGVEAFEADALYFLHFAYTFIFTEKKYIKGSSQSLSDALAAELEKRGGTLLLREEVTSVDSEAGKIIGCQTRRYCLRAPHMVWTGCPNQLPLLATEGSIPDSFNEQLAQLQLGLGAFIVYLGLDCPPEECGLVKQDYLIADCRYLEDAATACHSDLRYQRWPLSISNYHALDPSYGNVVQLEILDQASDWFALSRSDYKARKELIAQQIMQRAEEYFPGLRDKVRYIDISTPRTNQKFTNSSGGSAFGYKPLPKRNSRFLQHPPLQGLQFVGTWINGAGYEPAMCLGFTAATLRVRQSLTRTTAT